jgi:hypothetical protein
MLSRLLARAMVVVLALAGGGCGFLPSVPSDMELIVENKTNADAVFKIVEYDFEANEPGREIVPAMGPLGAGGTTTARMAVPSAESWALLVNDMLAITSFGVADLRRQTPASDPLVFHIAVHDGALEVSALPVEGEAGVTTEPAGGPP